MSVGEGSPLRARERREAPEGARGRSGAPALASATRPAPSDGLDLLGVGPVRAVITWGGFPYVLQLLLLAIFVALAWLGWNTPAPEGVNAKSFAKAHLTTLVIWGLWWPAMVWMAVLLGRAWCMVCPLELASNTGERLGRRLGVPQRALRRWMISGPIILGLYGLVQLLVAGAHINRVPAYTSWFLIGLLGAAVVTGLFFKDRAFCRGFCPVGLLLGTYGRGGMLAVRAGAAETCRQCTGKDCILACNRTRLDRRSCPSLLNPPRLNSNRDCLVCGQCIKACAPDNMRLLVRRPFSAADERETRASWSVTLFVMLASGFVAWEVAAEWPAAERTFLLAPEWVTRATGLASMGGVANGLWALALVPAILWGALGGLARACGDRRDVRLFWRTLAFPAAVVVAAGHMAKGLAKLVSWAPSLPGALRDPTGAAILASRSGGSLEPLAPLLGMPVVSLCGVGLLGVALALAVREYRLAHPGHPAAASAALPLATLASLYAAVVAGWSLA